MSGLSVFRVPEREMMVSWEVHDGVSGVLGWLASSSLRLAATC